jgi:hypothetical protein
VGKPAGLLSAFLRMFRRRCYLHSVPRFVVLFTLAIACSKSAVPSTRGEPLAALSAPARVVAGDTAVLDASASQAPGGRIVEFDFVFGDGMPAATVVSPQVSHVFTGPGVYEAEVIVRDDLGKEARAKATITVIPDVLCAEDEDCAPEDHCESGHCRAGPAPACAGDGGCPDGGACIPCETTMALCPTGASCVNGCCQAAGDPQIVQSFPNPIRGGSPALGLAWDTQTLWAVDFSRTLSRIDRQTGRATPAFQVGPTGLQPTGLAYTGMSLYLSGIDTMGQSANPNLLMAINPADGTVEATLTGWAGGLAPADSGAVWLYQNTDRHLRRIAVPSGMVVSDVVYVGMDPLLADLASDGTRVFAVGITQQTTGRVSSRIVEIQPGNGAVARSFDLPEELAYGLTFDGVDLWVSGKEQLYRLHWPR